jgi:uncharacterized protein (DUF885 family)
VSAIDEAVTPAYRRFRVFLVDEYVPKARATLGARDLPDGAAYYDMLVKRFTTLDLTADQVHAIGLREVAALRAEMEQVMRRRDSPARSTRSSRSCGPTGGSTRRARTNC